MTEKICPNCNSVMIWDGLGWECKVCGECVDPTPEEVRQAVVEDWKCPKTLWDGLYLLPPKQDVCPECATKHKPKDPHNQQSLYYQMQFRIKHDRSPTWEDAMSHCNEETKRIWREELVRIGEKLGGKEC